MTRTWGRSILIASLLGLIAATLAVWGDDLAAHRRIDEQAETVQRLLGGLGLGAAVDLSVCPFSFDPRLSCHCAADLGPIPGASWFCPQHVFSVFSYRSLSYISLSDSSLDAVTVPQQLDSEHVGIGHAKIP